MVRETRYLWVGNLPENIREDRIREHFKRYGRVQSVKLLPRGEVCPVDGGSSSILGEGNEGGSGSNSGGSGGGGGGSSTSGVCATVAFMDIKSAAKAHAIEHTLDDRVLTAQYYEPQHLQHRFPSHGNSEDHGSSGGSGGGSGGAGGVSGGGGGSGSTGSGVGVSGGGGERGERGSESFDSRGSHGSFYGSERSNRVVGTGSGSVVGGSGSGSGNGVVGGHPTDSSTGDPSSYISRRPPPTSSYHVTSSRARDRLYPRTGPYVSGPPPPPHLDRHRGSLPPSSWSAYEPTSSRYGSAPPPPSPATNDSYQDEQGGGGGGGSSSTGALRQHKKQRRKSRSGSSSPSGSSRSGSSSSSRSGSSGGSTSGGSTSPGSSPHRTSNVSVMEDRRPVAICVRNLPIRSSDSSLKDGLFHEYKKHGKVTWVKVIGTASERYALVCFRKPEDVEKALEVSQDKLFFGCKIEVAPYQGYDVEDNEFRPYEAELDEYHPKATRTLFIGNLEKDVTASELRKHFEPFGEIIEIDIKKQGAVSSYAFCQYSDIGSVVKAMRSMDGEHLGANRIKLGFGKSMPTPCVWVDGIGDCTSEKFLSLQFNTFGPTTQVVVDRERGHALVFFDQISCAQAAVKEMRGVTVRGRRLQIDFASRECQETFYEHLERQGNRETSEKPWDSRPSPASSFDMTRERNSFDSATVPSSSNRFTRYDTPPRSRTTNYSRTSGGSTPGASPAHPTALSRSNRRSYQDSYYDGDYAEPASRRFRSYDEFSQGSGASHDDYQSSVLSDGKLNDDDCPPPSSRRHAVQSVVTSIDPPAPPPPLLPPPDIRHLQKERVHLLEQLEECHSSGDEVGFVSKKRAKLDNSSTTTLCEDEEPEIASLLVTSHSSRKGMDFRRVSDSKVVVHHSTRRGSCEGRGPGPCKRRRDASSRHHEHHDGSRPGTPLVDERPENLIPSEPRRFRERSHEGPLSLPLPRFATQMLNNNNNTSSSNNNNGSGTRSNNASLAKIASPPCASLSTAPSPRAAPQPPASPPPRHASSSPTSSDSETAPQSPSLEERIRSLDEKYEKWSGSRALSAAGGDALAKLDASASERFRFRHKLLDLDLHEVQPSDIVKSVLAKRSVFDEDSKRLENFSEKYEPREFTGVIGVSSMIGSTAGLTTSGGGSGCTSKVCLQYPFPSHPPIQPVSGTSVTSQIGVNTPLSASLTSTTTMASSALKTDPRMQHNCIHPTPATPITPGTSIKTVSPELPPVSLPIGLGSGTAASNSNGSGLSSASSLVSSNGSVSNIHTLGTSTHRGLSISATIASPTVTAASTDTFNSTAITTAVPVTTLSATTSSTTVTTSTMSTTGTVSSMTTSSIAPPSSITSSSNSSSSSSLSASSTDLPRSRLRKESGSNRESRDSRDGRDSSRDSKHSKGKDCQRRSRKDETDIERNRKGRDEKESTNIVNDVGNTDNHSRDFKDNKELRYERKEREEKERRDKEDRDRQERRDKEDRDRQEKKEREERERREKDEERRERERLDKERQEKDRREREERERERKEREENELKEKERREKERLDRERREREEKERQERREREERERKEHEEREKKEREIRLEREKQEKERLKREREEQERREKEERDRIERERRREEKERLEREKKREKEEKERLERERRKEKEEREKMEKEKRDKEEREKLEREKHEKEKRREREDQERREKEKVEREKRRDREEKDKEKRERDDSRRQSTENHLHPSVTQSQSQVTPAPVPIKRRCSSQDCPTDEDAKRMKISDHRRDSKDRSRQNRRSEDRKHRNDSHRSSRESRESRDSKESGSATQDTRDGELIRENNSRDSGSKEKQRSKKNRSEKESRERSPRVSHESEKEFLSRLESSLSKRNDSTLSTEQASVGSNHTRDTQHHQQQQSSTLNSHSDVDDGPISTHEIQTIRNPSATDTDSDEPKKHSIFDIVDDEPAYISMYDKVKARSTKNMQKLEEEKRQVRLKDKFSQLKQSRARREEKKQSTSWDGDSVSSKALTEDEATSESDSTRTKSLSRKGSRSRIHSDTSEEEEPFNNKVRKTVKTERFLESDVDLGFADTEEKQNPLEASNTIVNSVHTVIKEEPRTSDEDERISVGFRTNHPAIVVNNHERDSRKKSHKKKQKRQKNSISNENNLKVEPMEALEHKTKTNLITSSNTDCRPNHGTELTTITVATTIVTTVSENAEERMRADKKQRSKKDKRRDRNGEDKAKARRKRLNRQEARDSQRMEDIFGPLSDDVDDGPSNTFFNRFNNMTSENSVYASDSDGGRSSLDMDRTRRKTEKKRRHQPEDENSVDLAEAGREIEAKLLGMPSSPKTATVCTAEPGDHDVFRFTDDNDSVEPSTPSTAPEKIKEKKKKRKKSKEERNRKDYHHHHHHHHHHHEKSGVLPYLGAEPSPPRASSPLVSKTISSSLPAPRETLLSPIPKVTSASTVSSITPPVVSDIQIKSEKKKDKFIPGFGIEIDETIHENAVKSISEPDEKDSSCQSRGNREESEVPVPTCTTPPAQNEDKPRVAISQEETEDAVAALLEETFGASTEDFSYEGEEEETETDGITGTSAEAPQEDVEEMQQAVESLNASTVEGDADLKPDTPQSEHDLQIDTDTEEDPNYETVDLTQPPKTPDIPSFYKSPTKTLAPVLTAPEKSIEVRLTSTVVTKPQSPPSSVIAHSWTLNEHNKPLESVKPVKLETTESDVDVVSPERTAQAQRTSPSPPPLQYKQPMLVPCSVPITSEIPKSLSIASSRPSPITVQPLYQRLPVSPQSQMVPMRQASPKMQTTTVSCSSSSNTTPLPPLIMSRIPPLVPSQSSPRISQPLSPNGQWSRNPTLSPHVPNVGKRKASPPPTKIAVCVPIPAHRPEAPVQQIYSTAATQQPVIQHASGMLAPTPGYPRGGLPPLTLNIPPRPYMPVPPLASGIQVKNSRDSSLGGKSVIETLLPINPNEPSQRLEEPKLSSAVIPEPTNKASTSPKVPSPNQPPTYIPETAKIEINASTSSPVFGKSAYVTDSYTTSRTQKQISVSITTDSNLLSPRQKQEVSNLQLLTTHVPRSSTPSPVIVVHSQSHLLHKSVHTLGPPNVPSPNQSLIKTVVPIVPQQITSSAPLSVNPGDKSVIPQTPCQRQSPVSQSQLVKSHIPLVSTESQTIITRVVSSTASSMSTPPMNECLDQHIQGQQLEMDAEAQINQTAQPMQLTPPIQSTQPIDVIKQEPIDAKPEETMSETEYNITESETLLNQPCVEDNIKQEKQEVIKTEVVPKVEVADVPITPKLEAEAPIKLEPMNEIKEEIKENDEMELEEEPVEDPLKEPSTDPLAIDPKEDPTDSKEDSDYWSAKEVNIESVIKKVDALCDGEGNDGDDEAQQTESANSDSHDTSKNESDWFDAESSIEGESKKNFGSAADEHDETMETCENESTKSRRGRAKSRRGSRGGVATRRGRNANAIPLRRGGRSLRGSKHHVEKNKLPADVYEFHDDSEEDNAGRPRLILTIKSPGPNVTGPNAQPAIPVAAVKEIPSEEFVSPAANTRKSRRLAERDGSRSTIDDVIEDVVRGSPANKGLVSGAAGNVHATRRSTRHNNAPRNTTQQSAAPLPTELRKSPRGGRKTARRTSENNEDSGEEKAKEVTVTAQEIQIKEEPKPATPESPKAEEPAQTVVTSAPQKTMSLEPMTLIDPVTGMLIPMRESEEGQYIPVSTSSNQVQTINRAVCEPRSGGLVSTSPINEAPRVKSESSPLVAAESKKEAVIEHASCQSTPTQPIQPQTSVITKPQSPTIQVTSTITIAQSSPTTTTIVSTTTATSVASITTTQPIPTSSSPQTKPTSLKAHVLNASKLVTSAQQQVITKPVTPSLPNQTIVQNIVKSPAQPIQSLNLQIPSGRVVSPSLSPRAKQAAQLTPANASVKQGQPMSPVLNNTGVPPNPKQHLLQAAKQQTSTIVNMSQKMPINMHPASVNVARTMHQPVSQPTTLKGINGQPHPHNPKTHLLQAVPPIVSGSSSTQPHLVNPQPISTGSARPPVPKTPATGIIEPQKVEVPMSGCIMVPTASPQSRSIPMPTYEAPLHGSTGATPPGGQYGLVPPHRSQSPPLPPPAHHHVNTSQSEVVNYGGLTRGGELPPHYLHSQMLQYQYHLRAQQEALTAPRIAYHIPGTRSPHLPLDPKLETGIEDSHSPPLELRRGTRTPQDRTTDSPQVAQVYMLHGNVRLPPPPSQYNAGSNPSLPGAPASARAGYYEPPPAHLRSQYPMAASEAPPEMGRAATPERCRKHHVVTPPPYASQVPPQADSFQMLLQRYPVMWQGLLALKNDQAAVQMHFVFGNPNIARDSLPCNSDGSTPPLRIAQRMRLEQSQVDGVARKMQTDNEHCMLLALPCGRDEVDVLQQSKNLQAGFITYLRQKQAAGIVNIAAPGSQQPAYVVHIFPSCEFANNNLTRIAPDLLHRVEKIAYLLIIIATV